MPDEVYTGEERRKHHAMEVEAIEAIVERLMNKVIAEHEARERIMWNETMDKAFPGGDPEAHRNYHQTKIDAAKAEQEFWTTIKSRLVETGIVGTVRLVFWLLFWGATFVAASRIGQLPALMTWLGNK